MKVLHILGTFGVGGAETWLMELLRYWHKVGSEAPQVDFIVTNRQLGVFDEEVKALGSKLFYLPYRRARSIPFVTEFRRILRDGNYSALHDHQAWVSGWHFLFGAGRLPPVRVAHVHNPADDLDQMGPVREGVARAGLMLVGRLATHIAGTSRAVLTEYGFDSPAFERIPTFPLYCAFDPGRFCGDPDTAKAAVCREFGWPERSAVILVAGRIDPFIEDGHPANRKNTHKAISVGLACAVRDPRIRVLFAGTVSPAIAAYRKIVDDAGCSDRVVFAGERFDIGRLMLASDVLLFPSRTEGLGMVAVEAQAAGLPVLAAVPVPKECVVISDLVRFRGLEAPAAVWADDIFELISQPRDVAGANKRVAESPFAIAQSAAFLLDLYRQS
jgi:glycosyltransferase EpsF